MTQLANQVFSEYEVRKMAVIFDDGDVGDIECISKLEQEATVITVQKKCRGVVAKSRTRGTGAGTLKVEAHIARAILQRLHDFKSDGLVAGVTAYGRNSLHPEVTIVADVYDEDDNEMLKAWPRCTVSTGPGGSTENGATEVAVVELEIAYAPDTTGQGVYEALVDDIESEEIVTAWMNAWNRDLVSSDSDTNSNTTNTTTTQGQG